MNFDQHIDRNEYPSMKWRKEAIADLFGNPDALPFWVADMDIAAPAVVIAALQQRVTHATFGYEYKTESYTKAITNWFESRHDWAIDPSHIEPCPGVLSAATILMSQHSEQGDGIIVQPPVFFEFKMVIRKNRRRMVKNPLKFIDGQYQMDFEDLEAKAANPRNKILILCNPHNPIGRVWTREELQRVDEICRKHDVRVISDEIHGDIVYPPHKYVPFGSLSEEAAQNAFICLSPAKTFNIAGMVDGMVVIANEEDRRQYDGFADRYQINRTNVLSTAAIEAAYQDGGPWLDELLLYLQQNISFIDNFLHEHIPQLKLVRPEGTYLVWLDFTALEMDAKALHKLLGEEAQLALNAGYWFGREGAGFARMNIAVPRAVLEDAMGRLKRACI